MLKIRDEVDLKELEKYGFINCDYYYLYEEKNDGWSNDDITIYVSSREKHKHYEDFSNDYLQYIIDDLIKADLVEKVDE